MVVGVRRTWTNNVFFLLIFVNDDVLCVIVCCKFEKPKTHPSDTSSSESCDSDDDRACNNYDRYPRHQRKAMREQKSQAA